MKTVFFIIAILVFTFFEGMAQSTSVGKEVRMMSYNIRNGKGMDNETDPVRIAKVINQWLPDVVALQEVDSITNRSGSIDVLHEIADEVLMYRTYASAIPYDGGKYGIGILSREKPLSHRIISLPGREEKRVLLMAEFKDFVFCNTHFSLNSDDRKASIEIILKELQSVRKPVFLAGDLNALPDSEEVGELKRKFALLTDVKANTFPADKPEQCIDYLFGYDMKKFGYALLNRWVVNEPMASDHRPVVADVRLKTDVADIFRTRPYLQNPVGNGITVSWLTNTPVYSWVEYGIDKENLKKAHTLVDGQVISNNYRHKIRLENLEPGKTYYYRVCSREILSYKAYSKVFGDTAVSDFSTFTLPDTEGTDFTALIFNDIHQRYQVFDTLFSVAGDIKYDFVVFNGDCIDDPQDEAQAVRSLSYYNNKVGADRIPVIYLRGNHEIRNAYSIELRDLFDYIGNKTYGSFNWGDTRFVMLDCGEDKPDSTWVYYGLNDFTQLRLDQIDFLKTELSSKDFKKASKRVLIHHIPVFGNDDKYSPCTALWGDMLKTAPFDVALNGHTHRYKYHPADKKEHVYPVIVGGGPSMKSATVSVLTKKGNQMNVKVINVKGEELLKLDL